MANGSRRGMGGWTGGGGGEGTEDGGLEGFQRGHLNEILEIEVNKRE